ncbi:MAG: hypothetical protein KAY24_20000 [Candidatus Eisenbacteria sp.]|nr:hypothetical protein [Candidatus Eisenbacteria bacterium]
MRRFSCYMDKRVPDGVEINSEGWANIYFIWRKLDEDGVSDVVIDNALGALIGGWYTPLGGDR